MADQLKNLMIGLFVTAAAAIVIFILMFLHPTIGDKGRLLHVRFTDIDKVNIGTRVTYAGKPVGEVVSIDEIPNAREGRVSPNGEFYIYDLTLLVDSGIHLYNTDEVSSRTSGLLGEKNIEITPHALKKGQTLVLMDHEPAYAIETGSVEQTFKEFKEAADKFETALDVATDILNNIKDNKLVDKVTKTVENVQSITAALNKPEQWSNILSNLDRFSSRINKSWDTVDNFLVKIDEASGHANATLKDTAAVAAKVNRGEGTLGRLLTNDDVYLRTSSIMSKFETILDDINHYGLLFQSDKGWQRLRARRLNLLQKLRSPQEFRNYFNDEVDQISTSISRVSMVLNEVENSPNCCNVMLDREFTKVFAELMRRVKMLEEEVRMYNTQLVEPQVHETELGDVCYPGNCSVPCLCDEEVYWDCAPWMWMPQYNAQ